MEVLDHVNLVCDAFLAHLDLKVIDHGYVVVLTTGSMAGAGSPHF